MSIAIIRVGVVVELDADTGVLVLPKAAGAELVVDVNRSDALLRFCNHHLHLLFYNLESHRDKQMHHEYTVNESIHDMEIRKSYKKRAEYVHRTHTLIIPPSSESSKQREINSITHLSVYS